MKNRIVVLIPLWLIGVLVLPQPQAAQTTADPQLVAEIAKIKAIDNHAHPLRFVAEGDKPDADAARPAATPPDWTIELIGHRDLPAFWQRSLPEARAHRQN